jgi:hypothetical protein
MRLFDEHTVRAQGPFRSDLNEQIAGQKSRKPYAGAATELQRRTL